MKQKKDDLRSRYTDQLIKNTLLSFLSVKPLKSVTVAELCKTANINRGTFYNHFYDVYDVYESVEDDLFREVCVILDRTTTDALDIAFFRDVMKLVTDNLTLVTFIVANIGTNSLLKRTISFGKEKYIRDFQALDPSFRIDRLESLFTYVLNGSIGIVSAWLGESPRRSADEVAETIDFYNRTLVRATLNIPH